MANVSTIERQFDIDIEELLKGKRVSESEIQERIKYIKETYKPKQIYRVCCFGRVSTKHAEQEMSLYTQRTMFENFIRDNERDGFVIVEEIYDRKSATIASKRPKFINMIERAKRGEFNVLLFKDAKRFSRNAEDFLGLTEKLRDQGIYIKFISDGIDNIKDDNRDRFNMLGMFSESHSNGLHKSVNAAMMVNMKREEGRMAAKTFGYDKPVVNDSRVFSINETEAELVREIYTRLANLEGPSSIVDDFRHRGIKTKYGKQFNVLAVRRIARNKKYIGILEMHKDTRASVRAERKKTDPSEWIIRYRDDLRILDDELFYKVQKVMDGRSNKEGSEKYKTIRTRLFTGLIKCDCCGKNLIRVQGGRKATGYYTYFQCISSRDHKKYANHVDCNNTKSYRETTLVDVFKIYLLQLLNSRDDIEQLIEQRVNHIIKKYKSELNKTSQSDVDITELREKLKRATELYIEGLISKNDLEKRKAELAAAERETVGTNLSSLDDINVKALCKNFFGNLEKLVQNGISVDTIDGKLFNSLFESITANSNGELDIVFKISDGCSDIINGSRRYANNNQLLQVGLSDFIDWEQVNSDMNAIRTSSTEMMHIHRLNKRYKTLGKEWFDKISIMI